MSPLETMDDYTSDFRIIFKEVSEEQIRKDPRTIISYMRDTKIDPAIIRVVDTMIMYSRMDFIASITSPDDSVLKYVDRIASNTFVDKGVLTQLINMMRDAQRTDDPNIGLNKASVVTTAPDCPVKEPEKCMEEPSISISSVKGVEILMDLPRSSDESWPKVETVAFMDPMTRRELMKAVDGSAVYSENLKELIRCNKGTEVLVMPNSVETIHLDAFKGCFKLREIYFPESMKTINGGFSYCSQLSKVHIPDTVTKLGRGCFGGCSSLTDIRLPLSLREIETGALSGCHSLREIVIPKNVVMVREYAFSHCKSLEKVIVQHKETRMENNAFAFCDNLEDMYVPWKSRVSERCVSSCKRCTIHKV